MFHGYWKSSILRFESWTKHSIGASMAGLAAELSHAHGLPVVDGVAAAVKLAESLAVLGLKTSKLGAYASPLARTYTGMFAEFAPRAA
jgi:allantoin racemase